MITVVIYGLDQYIVGRLSRELTPTLAKVYELSEDEISFVAPNNMVFHKGVEQTSWNVNVQVYAPMKVSVVEKTAASFILSSIGDVAINKEITFFYYSEDNRYTLFNPDYPRFITSSNVVNLDVDGNEDDEEYDEYVEGENEDEVYTGDMFEGVDFGKKEKL